MYHGFYIRIVGPALDVTARKYDDEAEMSIQAGVQETDSDAISILREIAKQLFNTDKLKILTAGDPPYKEI